MASNESTSVYAAWWSEGDKAKADLAIRRFTDSAWDHRESCPMCSTKQPCDVLHEMIDSVARIVREIGDDAFPKYVAASEAKYGHRDYWER